MGKRIIIIAPYPNGEAPSQRFRFEQYLGLLKQEGYEIEYHSFLSQKTWKALYKEGALATKVFGIISSFFRRFILLFSLRKFDHIFIHREASIIGPPIFEWIIAKVMRRKYIYDFDDAIWLPNYSDTNAKFHRLKAYWKVKKIMKWAGKISAGNAYLKEYALQFNADVHILPTTIDLENVHNIVTKQSELVNIGWTGTHTTMAYLDNLIPLIKRLEQKYSFTFTIISNQKPDFELDSLKFIQWTKESEIQDLATLNIGVMPLRDDVWAQGKCGFKALQYMALQIPSVVSPIGVNKEIIQNGENGYLCSSEEEWENTLSSLIENKEQRIKIGQNGQQTIENHYSVKSQSDNFLNLFK